MDGTPTGTGTATLDADPTTTSEADEPNLPDAPPREPPPFERRTPQLAVTNATRPTKRHRSKHPRLWKNLATLGLLAIIAGLAWFWYDQLSADDGTPTDVVVVTPAVPADDSPLPPLGEPTTP